MRHLWLDVSVFVWPFFLEIHFLFYSSLRSIVNDSSLVTYSSLRSIVIRHHVTMTADSSAAEIKSPQDEVVVPHVSTLADASPTATLAPASLQTSPQKSLVASENTLPTVTTAATLLHAAPIAAALPDHAAASPLSFIASAAGPPTSAAALPTAGGQASPSTNKPTVYNQENAYIESVYESVLLASGMLGHIERGSDELDLLRSAIQDVLLSLSLMLLKLSS